MEELIKQLKEHLHEESNDVEAYRKLAAHAYEHDREDISQILNDISDEEELHHRYIEEILEELE